MIFPSPEETVVDTLGPCRFPSPLPLHTGTNPFIAEDERLLVCSSTRDHDALHAKHNTVPSFELAGPREQVFFDPPTVVCGIVTCGGICPGLNNVIRAIVLSAHHSYGAASILGFRYGYEGLSASGGEPLHLTPQVVDHIHEQGGTILGTSRGPQDASVMVETLLKHKVNILFVVGGDGTLRGGADLAAEVGRRGLPISVIGVPKTVDNDLNWVSRSFGFTTAVEEARTAIQAAHVEARSALNGIGLVKLMGRHSGFIAAHATVASHDVNFCLVPEVPFELDGPRGLLRALEDRLEKRKHAVVVVAEGAGQDLMKDAGTPEHDASGNIKLKDIGVYLKARIAAHLQERGVSFAMKYIDPSYMIRSLPACAVDSEFCSVLGQHALHAGMAGRTNMVVGFWSGRCMNVPMPLVTAQRNQIDPDGPVWERVLDSTGQPALHGE